MFWPMRGGMGVARGLISILAAAQMRAVEEGITVIRSANTGISAVIAPNGDVSGLIGLNEEGVSDTALPKVLENPHCTGDTAILCRAGCCFSACCWLCC